MEYDVEVVQREPQDTAVVTGRVPHGEVGPFIGTALGEVMAVVGGAVVVGAPFCRVDMDGDAFVLEAGFPVVEPITAQGRVVPSSLPGGLVATILHAGPYASVPPAYFALEQWLPAHGYRATGAPWEAYLDGPEVPDPRTLVCWPCARE